MPVANCADATLSVYLQSPETPWNQQRALHLYRRISFGVDLNAIKQALNREPHLIIDELVDEAINMPLPPEPEWAYWRVSDYNNDPEIRNEQIVSQILELATTWVSEMKSNHLRDRMSWFWHNHFVTRLDDYQCPSWMYQYVTLLKKHALGNFKDFVREISITPAMLIFLSGFANTKEEPNENFARELYELFTLGIDNGYTQEDIEETARALTGWNGVQFDNLCGDIVFVPQNWDDGEKTIFGQTGNWGFDDVIDILFEQRPVEISEFICRKLYAHFVNPKLDEEIITDLAIAFRDNNFEIAPVLRILFQSEHFFDEANLCTVIPGHIEFLLTFINEVGIEANDDLLLDIAYFAAAANQRIFNPVDVAGWPGNRYWINTNSINARWSQVYFLLSYQFYNTDSELFRDFAKNLVGEEDDVTVISKAIVDYFLPNKVQLEIHYEELLMRFKSNVPENYFENGIWNLNYESVPNQVALLIYYISLYPDFQLK